MTAFSSFFLFLFASLGVVEPVPPDFPGDEPQIIVPVGAQSQADQPMDGQNRYDWSWLFGDKISNGF